MDAAPPDAHPEPALPMLGSHLLALEQTQRRRFADHGCRISSGSQAVDKAVFGGEGLERGVVLGISAKDLEGRLVSGVCLHHLATFYLLQISHMKFRSLQITVYFSVLFSADGSLLLYLSPLPFFPLFSSRLMHFGSSKLRDPIYSYLSASFLSSQANT